MNRLAPEVVDRLCKILGRLGSDHAGERAAAGLKAHELVKRAGLQWADLIAPPLAPLGWRDKVRSCLDNLDALNQREREFVLTLMHWNGTPTPRQLSWLEHIVTNLP
jgi:hypothetical protein